MELNKLIWYRRIAKYPRESEADFATRIGISEEGLRQIESGETDITVSMLDKIAQELGTRAGDLLCKAGYTTAPDNPSQLAAELRICRGILTDLEADANNWSIDARKQIRSIDGVLGGEDAAT